MTVLSNPPPPGSVPPVIVVGGGQSGLAAARALRDLRMPTVILEASDRPTGIVAALLRQPAGILAGWIQLDARDALPGLAGPLPEP